MSPNRTSLITVALLSLPLIGSAQTPLADPVAAGKRTYMIAGCHQCHGTVGQGGVGPRVIVGVQHDQARPLGQGSQGIDQLASLGRRRTLARLVVRGAIQSGQRDRVGDQEIMRIAAQPLDRIARLALDRAPELARAPLELRDDHG